MEPTRIDIPDSLRWAAQNFSVDLVTAEVTAAFDAAEIDSILLKGPTIATWLYGNDQPRFYGDTDLLIQKGDWAKAHRVLQSLGFLDDLAQLEHPRMESDQGYSWSRPTDGAGVDLHCTLFGLGAEPDEVWKAFSSSGMLEPVGGELVRTPSHAARLLHIALHAVQHGGETPETPMGALERRPMVDLELALARAPLEVWQEACDLAEHLGGTPAFATGLSLTREGRRMAVGLGVDDESSVEARLRLQNVPMSEGFAELSAVSGLHAKAALLWSELFPNRDFMRWWKPLASKGWIGLGTAYLWRPFWLAYRAIPGYLAWRRASRSAG